MTAAFIPPGPHLKMRRQKARKTLESLIARGIRLMLGIPTHIGPDESPNSCLRCAAWYDAVHAQLNAIYPTPQQSDLVIKQRNRGMPPQTRIQNIVDLLADFRDSIDQHPEPPLPYTWRRLVQDSALAKGILFTLGSIGFMVLGAMRKEIAEWLARLFR